MADIFEIHPTHPQQRLIDRSVSVLHGGGIVVYPTDSGYALGCHMGDRTALERVRKIRGLSPRHHFTLMCRDLSEIAVYARVNNPVF
ncbi:MAG: Sua5/YciO/YrdC/YwlC family protein, partial [Coxiellaceae bacterium]|nr:Sua5/YciO/YrdC/YwlC family protein [Coxiellaceae bacterium]